MTTQPDTFTRLSLGAADVRADTPAGASTDLRADASAGATGSTPGIEGGRPRLRRSGTDRMLAGVCGGIAEHADIDPIYVRLAFLVSLFWGGIGIFLYLAAALVMSKAAGLTQRDATPGPFSGESAVRAGVGSVSRRCRAVRGPVPGADRDSESGRPVPVPGFGE